MILASIGPTKGNGGMSEIAWILADHAVQALADEAELTPKPGLVDGRGSGSHSDMTLELMLRSAEALRGTFAEIALAAYGRTPDQPLREQLAAIGRCGEQAMLAATGGVNTHRGAIWALGLLVAGAAIGDAADDTASRGAACGSAGGVPRGMADREAGCAADDVPGDATGSAASEMAHGLTGRSAERIAATAGAIARFVDRAAPPAQPSHGLIVKLRYGATGALDEARNGFPHVTCIALPALRAARRRGEPERLARLNALITLIASLGDTCLLYRGGVPALEAAKLGAQAIIAHGGVSTIPGRLELDELDATLRRLRVSPGGSADLLAAALFLDRVEARDTDPPEEE
jgi:triphosphoribosyl-dephospho-CoA synthase